MGAASKPTQELPVDYVEVSSCKDVGAGADHAACYTRALLKNCLQLAGYKTKIAHKVPTAAIIDGLHKAESQRASDEAVLVTAVDNAYTEVASSKRAVCRHRNWCFKGLERNVYKCPTLKALRRTEGLLSLRGQILSSTYYRP